VPASAQVLSLPLPLPLPLLLLPLAVCCWHQLTWAAQGHGLQVCCLGFCCQQASVLGPQVLLKQQQVLLRLLCHLVCPLLPLRLGPVKL
jgi:hypothetical protein